MARKPAEHSETKQRLLDTGLRLFSAFGYEGTSARRIAQESDTNIASISFWFGNKEGYYNAVLEYALQRLNPPIGPNTEKFREVYKDGTPSRETLLSAIDFCLTNIIQNVTNNKDSRMIISLLFREPPEGITCTIDIHQLAAEMISRLSRLISDYSGIQDPVRIGLISRTIIGSIISFGEHPDLTVRTTGIPLKDFSPTQSRQQLKDFLLGSIIHLSAEEQ